MWYGINAGFGETIKHEFQGLRDHKFTAIRQDLTKLTTYEQVWPILTELRNGPFTPLWIIRPDQLSLFQSGEHVELLNEPNFFMSPEEYATICNEVAPQATAKRVHLYVGSISNLTRDVLSWMSHMWKRVDVPSVHVSVHRYPNDGGVMSPHRGFSSRDEEVTALREIVGDNDIVVTEFGYHNAWRLRWKFFPTRWTERQTARMIRTEWDFWHAQNVKGAFLYQLNDGPGRSHLDHYGIRRFDGTWKPSATAHWQ